MSIKLSDSIRVGQQKPLEDKYFNELVPYTSTSQVNTLLPKAVRHIGLTVNINGDEYWYKDGIENENLVLKVNNIDTSNLVPYNGANEDVNIGANYFKTSKGFDFTYNNDNYFRTFKVDNHYYILELKSKDNSEDNFGSISLDINPEGGFQIGKKDSNDLALNSFQINNFETFSLKPFVSYEGFKTPTGTANQALTANGGTFDLDTKADLENGKIPATQLPSYVDDVLEFANLASFPATGESGKIYIAIDTNLTYRWGGSSYVVMSSSLALGETSSTAYRGDRGKIAYDHSQVTGNPHNTTKSDIGLGNVPNIDATNPTNIVQTSSYRFVTDSEKANLTNAYNHSQATGNPHGTGLEQLSDVSGTATSIIDDDVILKKESGGFWKKITFANFKNWFTTELAKKINIGVDTFFNFKNISAMTLTEFRSITPDLETIYFTEEQNGTGWQQIRYPPTLAMGVNDLSETPVMLPVEDIELDSDSTFNLIDVENIKINGIFEKDFVIINFSTGVYIGNVTPNQWFKLILRVNGVQVAASPAFFLVEPYGTYEEISHSFALNVTAEMVTHGATLHIKKSDGTITFAHPTITVVRVHKSTNANL